MKEGSAFEDCDCSSTREAGEGPLAQGTWRGLGISQLLASWILCPPPILGGRKAAISITGTEPLCLHSSLCHPGLLPDMLITWKGPCAPAGIKSAPKLLLLVNAQVEVRPHALLLWEPAGSLSFFISSSFKFLPSFACRKVGRLSVQNSSIASLLTFSSWGPQFLHKEVKSIAGLMHAD